MTADRIQPPPRPAVAPEYIGPERLDVSHETDRSLLLRAVDGVLRVSSRMDRLETAWTNLRAGLHLEIASLKGEQPFRDPDASYHDFDAQMIKLRESMRARAKDPRDAFDDRRASELVGGLAVAVAERRELAVWRSVKRGGGWIAGKALEHLVTLLVGGGAVLLWHWLQGR